MTLDYDGGQQLFPVTEVIENYNSSLGPQMPILSLARQNYGIYYIIAVRAVINYLL